MPELNRQLWVQGKERASPTMTHATPQRNGGMPVQVQLSPGNMAPGIHDGRNVCFIQYLCSRERFYVSCATECGKCWLF